MNKEMTPELAQELYKASVRTFEELTFLLVTEGIDDIPVCGDVLAGHPAGQKDLYPGVAAGVELPADFLDDRAHVPPAGPRGVEPDGRRPAFRRP